MKVGFVIGIAYGLLAIFFTFVGVSGAVIPWPITVLFALAISGYGFLDATDHMRD